MVGVMLSEGRGAEDMCLRCSGSEEEAKEDQEMDELGGEEGLVAEILWSPEIGRFVDLFQSLTRSHRLVNRTNESEWGVPGPRCLPCLRLGTCGLSTDIH